MDVLSKIRFIYQMTNGELTKYNMNFCRLKKEVK
jgi:hypothetical protein